MRVIGWFWFARREASALDQSPGFAMGGVRLCQARLLGCTVRAERFARPKHRVGVVEGSRRGGKRTIALCPACHRILRSEPQLWLEMIGSKARRIWYGALRSRPRNPPRRTTRADKHKSRPADGTWVHPWDVSLS